MPPAVTTRLQNLVVPCLGDVCVRVTVRHEVAEAEEDQSAPGKIENRQHDEDAEEKNHRR